MDFWMGVCLGWLAGFAAGCLFICYLVKKVREADRKAGVYDDPYWKTPRDSGRWRPRG